MSKSLNSSTVLTINNLHHAYLVVGSPFEAERFLHDFFEKAGFPLKGSPDFFVWNQPTFGVDDARAVSTSAVRKSFTTRKVFLIISDKLTLQAQNALLKTFEDPTPDTHFFLVVREEGLVVPTLRSRMQILHLAVSPPSGIMEAENFLKSSLRNRLIFAKKFAESESNISIFLDGLLTCLKQTKSSSINKVYKLRLLSDTPSVSSRLILEHLSVVL